MPSGALSGGSLAALARAPGVWSHDPRSASRGSPAMPLCLRVRFAVGIDELSCVDVGVALRRAEPRVAEQFLNGAQIRAGFEQMRGERVPQGVRTDAVSRAA